MAHFLPAPEQLSFLCTSIKENNNAAVGIFSLPATHQRDNVFFHNGLFYANLLFKEILKAKKTGHFFPRLSVINMGLKNLSF